MWHLVAKFHHVMTCHLSHVLNACTLILVLLATHPLISVVLAISPTVCWSFLPTFYRNHLTFLARIIPSRSMQTSHHVFGTLSLLFLPFAHSKHPAPRFVSTTLHCLLHEHPTPTCLPLPAHLVSALSVTPGHRHPYSDSSLAILAVQARRQFCAQQAPHKARRSHP
jgi:hypothetical protein